MCSTKNFIHINFATLTVVTCVKIKLKY